MVASRKRKTSRKRRSSRGPVPTCYPGEELVGSHNAFSKKRFSYCRKRHNSRLSPYQQYMKRELRKAHLAGLTGMQIRKEFAKIAKAYRG